MVWGYNIVKPPVVTELPRWWQSPFTTAKLNSSKSIVSWPKQLPRLNPLKAEDSWRHNPNIWTFLGWKFLLERCPAWNQVLAVWYVCFPTPWRLQEKIAVNQCASVWFDWLFTQQLKMVVLLKKCINIHIWSILRKNLRSGRNQHLQICDS